MRRAAAPGATRLSMRTARPLATALALALALALPAIAGTGCGDDTPAPPPAAGTAVTAPAPPGQRALRRTASARYGALRVEADRLLSRSRARVDGALAAGDAAALADALAAYGRACGRVRTQLVRIRMPIAAMDPAAAVANALAAGAHLADDLALAARAGRRPGRDRVARLDAIRRRQGVADRRLRAALRSG